MGLKAAATLGDAQAAETEPLGGKENRLLKRQMNALTAACEDALAKLKQGNIVHIASAAETLEAALEAVGEEDDSE